VPRSVLLGRPWPSPGEPLFTQEDTDWAIALHEQEAAEQADRCPLCGLPKRVCRDIANQNRFKAEPERCHATNAIARAQDVQGGDDVTKQSTAWSASLPEPLAHVT
jgi:hypothetical protein